MTPLLSVIIPVYNMQATVLRTVCSALEQANIDVEPVVCDDGSQDRTYAVVEALQNPHVRLITKPNGGVASALNAACEAATGKYCYVCAADDWIEPNCLQYPAMILETRPEVGFVYGSVQYHNEGTWRYNPPPYEDGYFNRHYSAISSYVWRREAWTRGAHFRDKTINDWDHVLQLVEMGYKGEVVPMLMYHYWLCQSSGYLTSLKANKQKTLADFKARWPAVTAEDF
jgi:chondroitin synthase